MNHHPQSLLDYFASAAPGEGAEAALAEAVERGLAAARMLVAIHEILGPPPAASGDSEGLAEALADADRLLMENMELRKENEALRERIAWLQRQVERLHNKKEMKSILERIEKAPEEEPSPAAARESFKEDMEIEAAARAPREEPPAAPAGEAKDAATAESEAPAQAPASA